MHDTPAHEHLVINGVTRIGRRMNKFVMLTEGGWTEVVMFRWRDSRGEHEEILMFLENYSGGVGLESRPMRRAKEDAR